MREAEIKCSGWTFQKTALHTITSSIIFFDSVVTPQVGKAKMKGMVLNPGGMAVQTT